MLAKVLFKPIGMVVGGIVAKRVGDRLFNTVYGRRYGTQAPTAFTEEATYPQVAVAAVTRATILAVTAVTFDRAGASGFRYLTGFWPGETRPKPASPELERSK
ncbi:unannotated protein [freshwater metagenome]|uniref:Unannotated protein n=1 Tax=freshwater metagenome TaxID=449393 RepID=A0A6J7IS83_9ZZZZ|nr:DUF4235 domain-containing protein [Actinomycetota bacterium]